MAPATIRKSPSLHESQNSQASSSSLSSFASHVDIPSTSDLTQLATILRERSALLIRRRRNLKADVDSILQRKASGKDSNGLPTLTSILDQLGEQVPVYASPVPTKLSLALPSALASRASQAPSPSPRALHFSASPAPSSTGQGAASQTSAPLRTKIKIKRDPDRVDRERSESVVDVNSTPAAESVVGDTSESQNQTLGGEASPSVEADWDEEAIARPGRTYQSKRKRQRNSQTKYHDDISMSDIGSPAPLASQQPSPQREISTARALGAGPHSNGSAGPTLPTIKLKLNPTAHTAPMRNDALNPSIRRPSILRGRDDFAAVPLTPMQASQAAMWELPKRTPDTFIPKPAPLKPIRTYPTRPEEVDVDFAKMDWRERDKERDRLEAAASANGPGPGQAVIKEGTAASRARDRKQDQVAHHTFQQWTDGWFRTLTEEDLAWVSSKSDELDAFQFPSLGRHYSEVWEEEEANAALIPTVYLPSGTVPLLPASAATLSATNSLAPNGNSSRTPSSAATGLANGRVSQPSSLATISETPKFDPRNLKDDHLYGGSSEDVRSGPFTERLLAALLPTPPSSVHSAADASAATGVNDGHLDQRVLTLTNGHHSSSSSTTSNRPQDMAEFEERLRLELKAIDILGDEDIDWSDRADDEISSTLRTVQRLLRKQIRINELRKTRLFEIAMDRMAYQEYLGCLNSVEREIEAGWMKRQTQIKKSMQAQKKKKGSTTTTTSSNGVTPVTALASSDGQIDGSPVAAAAVVALGSTAMAPSSSSMGTSERGGGPIPPQFSESLLSAMEKRRQLKFAIEPLFADKPLAKETPVESVYKDLDLDV